MDKIQEYFMIFVIALSFLLLTGTYKADANIFTDIINAGKGHIEDVIDRNTVDDNFIDGTIISTGNFNANLDNHRDKAHYVNGTFNIVEKDGVRYVQLNEDFKAGLAPDLYIYVSEASTITTIEDFENTKQIELSKLTKGSGATYYVIPSDLNINSVTIWCKRFSQYMGSADLER